MAVMVDHADPDAVFTLSTEPQGVHPSIPCRYLAVLFCDGHPGFVGQQGIVSIDQKFDPCSTDRYLCI